VEARFYPDIADELAKGAIAALEKAGASYERFTVPGVLTVENDEQAWERARVNRKNKGGEAAQACLAMYDLKRRLSL
jgi:6,7-dimethyl-8-ribityllumazine synthase